MFYVHNDDIAYTKLKVEISSTSKRSIHLARFTHEN
jgi:hypothetical protein